MAARTLQELVDETEPGMDLVRSWTASARNSIECLPCDPAEGERTLLALQVTTRSPMGAIAYETGGILIDGGWLRILGAGCPELPRSIADWNGVTAQATPHRLPGACLVGDDVVGGFFAVNGGGLKGKRGNVFYLAPDTLRWEDMDLSYSDWVYWAFTGDLSKFYENARWPGWEREIATVDGLSGILIFPFLWAEGPPVAQRTRNAVPIEELWDFHASQNR
ncbi:DUF2625 domain-containing protein [Pendulispora brunnea]|uniref:DUF2625 domain-containing protein n=1 Tax=Pendulispora brunnea TaxID=2905690 RepID=A0ABZ2K1S9_9BACT